MVQNLLLSTWSKLVYYSIDARLHNSAINFISVVKDKYIITGGDDGFVKIFDLQVFKYHFTKKFKIIAWFEKLYSGPINSVSESTNGVRKIFLLIK